mgnify:CR=1 FL=1
MNRRYCLAPVSLSPSRRDSAAIPRGNSVECLSRSFHSFWRPSQVDQATMKAAAMFFKRVLTDLVSFVLLFCLFYLRGSMFIGMEIGVETTIDAEHAHDGKIDV